MAGQAPVYLQELIGKREEGRYNLRSCAMGIMLQTPWILTEKTLSDRVFLAANDSWNFLQKVPFLDILVTFRLDLSQITFNPVEHAFATQQLAFLATSIAF